MATTTSSAPQTTLDPWDQPSTSTSTRLAAAPTGPVPDDWENDDEEEEGGNEQGNQRIWNDANTKAPNPMPSLIMSPSATSTRTILSPPAGAFQPTMRILKRPTNSNSNPSTPPPPSLSAETLQEREARYQAARERIFGEEKGSANGSSASLVSQKERREKDSSLSNLAAVPLVTVVRNPKGPSDDPPEDPHIGTAASARGFRNRTTKPPAAANSSQDKPKEIP
ncbi:hypothetical protein BD779DRAFT_1479440 [Infundibulicybe gibba]|nr:hypothetical protein BD779DRAFT_1479440 [Infundibulicybe gibba]